MLTVVIDPGHGGIERIGGSSPNNATGQLGTLEKNITLDIALAAKQFFPSDFELVLTRETDENLGLQTRTRVAQNFRADAFISIQLNGWHTQNVQGTETYHYSSASDQSRHFANRVQTEILNVTGLRDRGVKEGRLGVINPRNHENQTAACLTEVSFLTDSAEEIRLLTKEYISLLGHAICTASINFLRYKYKTLSNIQSSTSPQISVDLHSTDRETDVEDAIKLNLNPDLLIVDNHTNSSEDLTEISRIEKVRRTKLASIDIQSFKNLAELDSEDLRVCAQKLNININTIKTWKREAQSRI